MPRTLLRVHGYSRLPTVPGQSPHTPAPPHLIERFLGRPPDLHQPYGPRQFRLESFSARLEATQEIYRPTRQLQCPLGRKTHRNPGPAAAGLIEAGTCQSEKPEERRDIRG